MVLWLTCQLPLIVLTIGCWYIFAKQSGNTVQHTSNGVFLLLGCAYILMALDWHHIGWQLISWSVFLIGHLLFLRLGFQWQYARIIKILLLLMLTKWFAHGLAHEVAIGFSRLENGVFLIESVVQMICFLSLLALFLIIWGCRLQNETLAQAITYQMFIEKKQQELQLWQHDMKNHLSCVMGFLTLDNPREAVRYLQTMDHHLQDTVIPVRTNHLIADILLADKKRQADEYGIEFEYYTDGVSLDFIKDEDMCAILGNVLDNALEGSRQSEDKVIQVDIYQTKDATILLKVSNSCDTPPMIRNEQLVSTKGDKKNHGFGLKSVRQTVAKYQGVVNISYDAEANYFENTIHLLNNPVGETVNPVVSLEVES